MIAYLIPLALLVAFLFIVIPEWWRSGSKRLQYQNDAVLEDIDRERADQGR